MSIGDADADVQERYRSVDHTSPPRASSENKSKNLHESAKVLKRKFVSPRDLEIETQDKTIFHKYGKVYAKPLFVLSPYLESSSPIMKKVFKPNPSMKLSKVRVKKAKPVSQLEDSQGGRLDRSQDSDKTSDEKYERKNYTVKTLASSQSIRTPYQANLLAQLPVRPVAKSPQPVRSPVVAHEPKWQKQSQVKLDPVSQPKSPPPNNTHYYVVLSVHNSMMSAKETTTH